ncbi:MAG: tripartite tricarboxylate transporter substrate binding protein [Betaproteobacteria bacterium]|nr:tripartite tricarboxylate transporter substrate binding protein [Betaproteobacteria bacterium]
MNSLSRFVSRAACAALACLPITAVWAQSTYPDRPLKLVVPFPPGGGTDAAARLVASALSTELRQPVVVENRAGAGGSIAAQSVVDAPADGYTLFFATTGTLAINQHLYSKLRHNPLTDLTSIAMIASFPNVLVVHPSLPVKSVTELIALARERQGTLTYGSSGSGSSSHLAVVLLESMTGVKFTHVPYKGSAPAMTDFVAGRIDMMIDNPTTNIPLAQAGKLRALAVSSRTRSKQVPDLPTIAEAGVPGYEVLIWYALVGPGRLPDPIVARLAKEVATVVGTPKVREGLEALGTDPMVMGTSETVAFVAAESRKWSEVIRASGARAD